MNLFPSTIGYPSFADCQWNEFFLNVPQCLGMSGDLSESGSFLTSNDLAVPILATQDEEGMFKAFVKSCRHRGVAVETADRGSKCRMVCAFHAWTYDTSDGRVGVPRSQHLSPLARHVGDHLRQAGLDESRR